MTHRGLGHSLNERTKTSFERKGNFIVKCNPFYGLQFADTVVSWLDAINLRPSWSFCSPSGIWPLCSASFPVNFLLSKPTTLCPFSQQHKNTEINRKTEGKKKLNRNEWGLRLGMEGYKCGFQMCTSQDKRPKL